jgi:O-antigen/teichoic acid export membrane protein
MSRQDVTEPGSDEGVGRAEPAEGVENLPRSSIARNVAQLLASQVLTWAMSLAVAITVPRFLGPTAVGQLRLAFSLWAITQVVIGLGTSMYLTLVMAKDRVRGVALVGPILVLRTVAFSVASVILAVFVSISNPEPEFVAIMVVSGIGILLGTWSDLIGAAFLGLERTGAPAMAGVVSRTIGTIVTVLAVVFGADAVAVVAIGAASSMLGLLMVLRSLRQVMRVRLRGWWAQSPAILKGSVAFMVTGGLLTVYREVDTVVMSVLVDREVLGWYGTADQLIGSSLFMVTIVMAAIFPVLGRLHATDRPKFVNLVERSYGSLLVAAVPIGLGVVVVAPQLVPLLYGREFEPTAQVLIVYGLVSPLTFGAILFGTVAITTGRQRFWNVVMLVGIVATIPLDLVFIPWADRTYSNGAIGGAMAYFVTEGFMFVIGLLKVCPYLINRSTMSRSARILLAGCLMFAAAWPLHDRPLVVPIVVGAVVYIAAIVALRVVTDDERLMVGRALERLGVHTSWAKLELAD